MEEKGKVTGGEEELSWTRQNMNGRHCILSEPGNCCRLNKYERVFE